MSKTAVFILVFSIGFVSFSYAQSIGFVVVDAEQSEPLPFATVSFMPQGTGGGYTDLDGFIQIPDSVDEIRISYTGYAPLQTSTKLLTDTIALVGKTQELKEVIVVADRSNHQAYSFEYEKHKNIQYRLPVGSELVGYIARPEQLYHYFVSDLSVRFDKAKGGVCRIKIYANEGGSPGALIYESEPKAITQNKNQHWPLSMTQPISGDGFFVGIEVISGNQSKSVPVYLTDRGTTERAYTRGIFRHQTWLSLDQSGLPQLLGTTNPLQPVLEVTFVLAQNE